MTRERFSPLGDQSRFYKVKTNEKGSILDTPETGILELYPAGYTHYSERDNISRQDVHKAIYEFSVSLGAEEELYPLKKDSHWLELVPDPSNKHDENAIHVILRALPSSILSRYNGRDMGFIPKKINKMILKNMSLINGGRIYKTRANFHKKYYTVKIVLGYGDTTFSPLSKTTLSRFEAILDE